ncbi:MAG: hypothetical protein ABIE14_05125, partial [Patescibacteria group bacterium]
NNYGAVETNRAVETRQWRVSTNNNDKPNTIRKFQQLPKKSISSIINHFKGATKKWADKNDCKYFAWQKNFYDHIIHDENELNRIRDYIFLNPQNWGNDKNNSENLYI